MEEKFLEIAKEAAIQAGEIISKYYGKKHQYQFKGGDKTNFATQTDLESEQKIVEILTKNFPDHNIIAEEGGGKRTKSEFTWFVDPLDGTFAFAQNIPYFTVSIGLVKNGMPIVGVINHVCFKNLYWASMGEGAFLNGKRIHVSKKRKLEETAGSLGPGHRLKRQTKLDLYINQLVTKIGYPYEFGSAAVSMAMVADGSLDLNLNQAYQWDFAAGTIIVREAGGKVTDFEGNELNWNKERLNVAASNRLVHEGILKALK